MIRKPNELIEPIKEAVDRKAVVFSHLLIALTVTIHTAIDPRSYGYQIALGVGVSVVTIVLAYLRFFDLARLNSRPKLYLSFYFLAVFIGFTFISDPATPYITGFFLLVCFGNLYYGQRGVWAVVVMLAVGSLIKYPYLLSTNEEVTMLNRLDMIVTFVIFLAVCSIFVNVQKVYDWDRARLNNALEQSALEQDRLNTLINNMTESVLVLNKNGVISLYNAAALALFDTNTALTGRTTEDFIRLESEDGRQVRSTELLPSGSEPLNRSDIVVRYGEEDAASLSVTVTPLHASFGKGEDDASYIMTLRDITREKSLEDERREFISVISHELRTPVTVTEASISNAMLVNDRGSADQSVAKSLKTAHDQALYLANMLNDLATFARAEQNELNLELEEVNPLELINRLREDYRQEVEGKGMRIEAVLNEHTPSAIVSNKLYLREVMQNFVTNALKYSDNGTITIKAEPATEGVKFSVQDQGIGISTSDQKKVFDKFFRAEDFRTRSSGGTGLGLYIVRKLAKLLGGQLGIESTVGKGSTFSITVPDLSERSTREHAELMAANIAGSTQAPPPAPEPAEQEAA